MIILKNLFLWMFLLLAIPSFCGADLQEQFKHAGYIEIGEQKQPRAAFDSLYASFDAFIEFLQKNPVWAQKLYIAKERFIRSKEQNYYSTDFFGLYDESKREGRSQISFYYSTHFHEFISVRYPEFNTVPEVTRFFEACREIQAPYGKLFEEVAEELDLKMLFSGQVPILFKVVKYLPSYNPIRAHYDGTAFSLFLDSTDTQALLLSPYKSAFEVEDFSSPWHNPNSILLIPGVLLKEFSIFPTPHIAAPTAAIRYSAIAFAMRPNYTQQKTRFSLLPNFRD